MILFSIDINFTLALGGKLSFTYPPHGEFSPRAKFTLETIIKYYLLLHSMIMSGGKADPNTSVLKISYSLLPRADFVLAKLLYSKASGCH